MGCKIDEGGAFISEAIWLVNEYFDLVKSDGGCI